MASILDKDNLPDILPAHHIFGILLKRMGLPLPHILDLHNFIILLTGPVPDSDGDGCVFCCDRDIPCVLWRKQGGLVDDALESDEQTILTKDSTHCFKNNNIGQCQYTFLLFW